MSYCSYAYHFHMKYFFSPVCVFLLSNVTQKGTRGKRNNPFYYPRNKLFWNGDSPDRISILNAHVITVCIRFSIVYFWVYHKHLIKKYEVLLQSVVLHSCYLCVWGRSLPTVTIYVNICVCHSILSRQTPRAYIYIYYNSNTARYMARNSNVAKMNLVDMRWCCRYPVYGPQPGEATHKRLCIYI